METAISEILGVQELETSMTLQPQQTSTAPGLDAGSLPQRDNSAWAEKTSAVVLTAGEFATVKAAEGLYVVGITGFSGQWDDAKVAADPGLKAQYDRATETFRAKFTELLEEHGPNLVISSGATDLGVPKIAYAVAAELGIRALGVTSAKAVDYKLGQMDWLVVEGADWGAESPIFLETSDEVIVLGGGGQAKKEALAASNDHKKPVTVYQGFGGKADELTQEEMSSATFVKL